MNYKRKQEKVKLSYENFESNILISPYYFVTPTYKFDYYHRTNLTTVGQKRKFIA